MPSKQSRQKTASAKKKGGRGKQMLISRFFTAAPTPNKEKKVSSKPKSTSPKPPILNSGHLESAKESSVVRNSQLMGEDNCDTAPPKTATEPQSNSRTPVKSSTEQTKKSADTPGTTVLSSPASKHEVVSSQSDDEEVPVIRKRRRRLFCSAAEDFDEDLASPVKKARREDPDFDVEDMGDESEYESENEDSMEVVDEATNEGAVDVASSKDPSDPERASSLASYTLHRGQEAPTFVRDPKQRRRFTQKIGRLEKNSFFLRRTGGGGSINESSSEKSKKAVKYTPLEAQFVKLRKQYSRMLLVVECGYKYRMFDQDASSASKVLRLAAYFDHNFLTCSFPTHRLAHYIRRLVAAGFKVGIISQSETAALKKASSKSSGLFERKLSAVYTKGTIAADGKLISSAKGNISVTNEASYIMSIFETNSPDDGGDVRKRNVAVAAVDCSSGEVFFDCFANDTLCSDLESRLVSVEPVEVIMPKRIASKTTELVVKSYVEGMGARLERVSDGSFNPDYVTDILRNCVCSSEASQKKGVPEILSCLGALGEYLKQFKLELSMTSALEFKSFKSSRQMKIGADVLRNFEVFGNSNNGSAEGSLIGLVNRTSTAFGSRQMRQWLSHPLTDPGEIRDRLDVVEYLCPFIGDPAQADSASASDNAVHSLVESLSKLPDLERGLTRVSCQKCSPSEFIGVLNAVESVGEKLDHIRSLSSNATYPRLLVKLFSSTPVVGKTLQRGIVRILNPEAAASNEYHNLFTNEDEPEEILGEDKDVSDFLAVVEELHEANEEVKSAERSINSLLRKLREKYNQPRWEWKKVAQEEYLIEVPTNKASKMPRSWTVISQTKAMKRFRPSEAEEAYEAIQCSRETRDAVSARCWQAYLETFSPITAPLRAVVRTLVELDCLSALARVSNLPGYCKPEILSDKEVPAGILAKDARHPLTESLPACTSYVPNDIKLGRGEDEIAVVISGPNYGGKSSYARMTALIAILAQIGSYVPASAAKVSPFDSIHARMGSTDSIAKGMSSLMVELSETSRILSSASNRSLVVLDELGRGTSTHDGSAIAFATLSHLVEKVRCTTLFVTHYPMLASLRTVHPKLVTACFMDYRQERDAGMSEENSGTSPKCSTRITFLYKLTEGVAGSSYGLNVARLAGIPHEVIDIAQSKATELENKVNQAKKESFYRLILGETTLRNTEALRKQLASPGSA